MEYANRVAITQYTQRTNSNASATQASSVLEQYAQYAIAELDIMVQIVCANLATMELEINAINAMHHAQSAQAQLPTNAKLALM